MVDLVQITHVFNGDPAASDEVNAAQLDTQLATLAAGHNAETIARQKTVRDGGGLVNGVVGFAALKPEVITSLAGLVFGQDVAVVAQTNIASLSGLQTIDGYTLINGDRVLLVGQTVQAQNGIYVASSGSWVLAYDSIASLSTNQAWSVLNGNSGGGTTWRVYSPGTPGLTVTTWIPIQGFAALLPISRGGTGANNANQALINLGVTTVTAQQFGAKADGVNDDTAAIAAAIASLGSGGGQVRLTRGTYKITDQILLNTNGISLIGDGPGNTILKQYTAGKAAVRVSQSFCRVQGMSMIANVATGVTGLRVAPVTESDVTTLGYINYNMFSDLEIESSDEGVYMAPGPDVATVDSQCFYNTFINVRTRYCKRGLYLADGPNASSAGVNRNTFVSCRFGETCNTGIHIRCGGTNQFISCHAEGISSGASPSATPVGFRIEASGTYSGANAENCFYGCVAEGCTWEWQNDAIRTNLFGGSVQTNHGSAAFEVQIGSRDLTSAQSQPLRINNAIYAQHLSENANLPNDTLVVPIGGGIALPYNGTLRPETCDINGATSYKWAAYNLAPQMTNVSTIGVQFSQWYVFGGFAEWHCRVQFKATVAATPVTINLPTSPDSTFLGGAMSNFVGHAYITNGVQSQLQAMPIVAGPAVSLTHPSNWATGSNINEIHFVFRFRISRP